MQLKQDFTALSFVLCIKWEQMICSYHSVLFYKQKNLSVKIIIQITSKLSNSVILLERGIAMHVFLLAFLNVCVSMHQLLSCCCDQILMKSSSRNTEIILIHWNNRDDITSSITTGKTECETTGHIIVKVTTQRADREQSQTQKYQGPSLVNHVIWSDPPPKELITI